jgi:F-type H+-transporting ATPase subunit a
MSITYDIGSFLAHLQPIGSPAALNPFLCVIELVSLLVRPITLAVRLTANLSTGHILMALLGVGFVNSGVVRGLVILFLGIFYFIFEIGVCFIQAYIFTLLPTLYLDEHPRDSH